jgi:hypothetical protein
MKTRGNFETALSTCRFLDRRNTRPSDETIGRWVPIGTEILLAFKPLWLADRRPFPRHLPPVDRQVEQSKAVVHSLDAAPRRPVSLEDLGPLSQVANDVHQAHPPSNQESIE